jgi:hypothetical protein
LTITVYHSPSAVHRTTIKNDINTATEWTQPSPPTATTATTTDATTTATTTKAEAEVAAAVTTTRKDIIRDIIPTAATITAAAEATDAITTVGGIDAMGVEAVEGGGEEIVRRAIDFRPSRRAWIRRLP